ncbi:MAG: hypothetical protein K8F52_00400, partial [Candidatus Scalindua rubra]|nr:hypothetical protein [Candidatus Scalindua rubra]
MIPSLLLSQIGPATVLSYPLSSSRDQKGIKSHLDCIPKLTNSHHAKQAANTHAKAQRPQGKDWGQTQSIDKSYTYITFS